MNSTKNLKTLLNDLLGLGVHKSVIREFLQAANGEKVSRSSLSDELIAAVVPILEGHGLAVALSEEKHFAQPDQGKGGWCNAPPVVVPATSTLGEHLIYVGVELELVCTAASEEQDGENDLFGESLGIPKCCRQHFETNATRAALNHQNDLTICTIQNSAKTVGLYPGANVLSQYFGYGLISYFPCSFMCQHAAASSLKALRLLESLDQQFAREFEYQQKGTFIYTEYEGIYAFRDAVLIDRIVHYCPRKIETTLRGALFDCLQRGDRIEIIARNHFRILSESERIADIKSDVAEVLVFDGAWT